MPVPIETLSLQPSTEPKRQKLVYKPFKGVGAFGGEVHGCDINSMDEETFLELQQLIYTHRILVIKGQHDLIPAKQQELGKRFDPSTPSVVGHMQDVAGKKTILNRGGPLRGKRPNLPDAFLVNINGNGEVEPGYFGMEEGFTLSPLTHKGYHKHELTDEQIEAGESRFQRWHVDCPFYKNYPARVTTIWAHTLPPNDEASLVNVRWDDGSDYTMKAAPGRTAFFDSQGLYESLSADQKKWVDHSLIEYGQSPYEWVQACRATTTGLALHDDGKELALEDLTDDHPPQTLPLLWINPVTEAKALQVHAIIAKKIHYRESADGEFKVIDDLATVRKMLSDLQLPYLRPENVFFPPSVDGDMLMFANRLVRHSAIDHPRKHHRRLHQLQLLGSDPPHDPVRFPPPVAAAA